MLWNFVHRWRWCRAHIIFGFFRIIIDTKHLRILCIWYRKILITIFSFILKKIQVILCIHIAFLLDYLKTGLDHEYRIFYWVKSYFSLFDSPSFFSSSTYASPNNDINRAINWNLVSYCRKIKKVCNKSNVTLRMVQSDCV